MGNNCKSVDKPNKVVKPHVEKVHYNTRDNNRRHIAELLRKVVRTKAKRFSTSHNGDTKKCPSSPHMQMMKFIEICSRNRPAGISDIDWDRFVSSICLECFWIDVQGEVDKRGKLQAETYSSRSSRRVGTKDLMLEEASGSLTPTANDSIVEYAEKFTFTDVDKSDVESKSMSSLSALSLSTYRPDRSLAEHYRDLSGDEKTSSRYDKELNFKYALSLGDIQCD